MPRVCKIFEYGTFVEQIVTLDKEEESPEGLRKPEGQTQLVKVRPNILIHEFAGIIRFMVDGGNGPYLVDRSPTSAS